MVCYWKSNMQLINKNILYASIVTCITMNACTKTAPEKPTDVPTTPQTDCKVSLNDLYGHYKGECKNGKAHGKGEAIGNDKYEGQFANGLPNGQGTYTWLDGASYTGQFQNGKIKHVGCDVVDLRLRGSYKGECRNGKAYGKGKAVGIDTYQGEFINGMPDGQGTYIWQNKDRYIGKFKEGKASGRGVMRYSDGTEEIIDN
jgi:hypothetical protein